MPSEPPRTLALRRHASEPSRALALRRHASRTASMRYLLVLLAGLAKEAASNDPLCTASNKCPCTAALGLQPVYRVVGPADQSDQLLGQGAKISVDVYAVNLCVLPDMETVDAYFPHHTHHLDTSAKSGIICIKPVSRFSREKQGYVPLPEFYDWHTVQPSGSLSSKWTFEPFEQKAPDWCAMCSEHPHGCFTMTLNENIQLNNDRSSLELFTIDFTLVNTITETMAENASQHEIVFQVQSPPAMVTIRDDKCTVDNKGGGQGSVPYQFKQASSTATSTISTTTRTSTTITSTTTLCEWPCCKELRSFMDNVEVFIQEKFDYSVAGKDGGRDGVCSDTCYAASKDECVNEGAGEPPFASEASRGPPTTWSPGTIEEAKVTRLEQEATVMREEASAMREKIDKLEQKESKLEQEALSMALQIDKLEREAKVMWAHVMGHQEAPAPPPRARPLTPPAPAQAPAPPPPTSAVPRDDDLHPPFQLVAGAQDEAVSEPPGTNIALVVVVSVFCAVVVQVVAAALPLGRPGGPSAREPLLLGQ